MVGGGRERDILEGARDVTTAISLVIRYEGPERVLEKKAHIHYRPKDVFQFKEYSNKMEESGIWIKEMKQILPGS